MEPTVHYRVYLGTLLVAVLASWIRSMPFLLFLLIHVPHTLPISSTYIWSH